MDFVFQIFATMVTTRSKAKNPAVPPPDCELRSSLPLPAELTQHILFFVSQPSETLEPFRKPKHCKAPPTDITNARLVCKTFAHLGSAFLLQTLLVIPDPDQLNHVKYVAQHIHFSKSVRTLVYDSRTYKASMIDSMASQRKRYIRLYKTQEKIFNGALDTACLQSAFPTLTGVTKIVCKPVYGMESAIVSDALLSLAPECYHPNKYDDTRPLYHLFAAIASTPTTNIRTMDLEFYITLLRDVTTAPAAFSTLCTAFATVKDLKLTICTEVPETDDAETRAQTSPTALLRTNALGTLVSSARSLTRLKLNLSLNGHRRGNTTAALYHLPLSAYLGPHSNDAPHTTWPDLRYLYLGSLDVRADEIVPFLLARPKIEMLEFDCVTLTQGQWAVVGLIADRLLPWRKLKQHYLKQVEAKREWVAWPEDVVREMDRRGLGGGEERREWMEQGEYYFEAKEESSTLSRGE